MDSLKYQSKFASVKEIKTITSFIKSRSKKQNIKN